VSHICKGAGEMNRLATRIQPQTQSKQIDEMKGSFDVEPIVGFDPNADRDCRRAIGARIRSSE
jgi:hypothetical protein